MSTRRTPPRADAFPSTDHTWLGRALVEGERGRLAAGEHVMRVYAEPLRIYLRGSSFRALGDEDELVHAFFASRLSKPDYLNDWLISGRPLRRWLIVGFRHHLLETIRERERARRRPEAPGHSEPAERAFHRESALAIVREALRVAQQRCRDDDLDEHWRVFLDHHLHGRPYDALGADPRRAAVMARTCANRFRAALRELVGWPGASDAQVDEELASLMQEIAG